jgi:hypothetical protein
MALAACSLKLEFLSEQSRLARLIGGKGDALDHLCDSLGFVHPWFGEQLHSGWFHSLTARSGFDRFDLQPDFRTTRGHLGTTRAILMNHESGAAGRDLVASMRRDSVRHSLERRLAVSTVGSPPGIQRRARRASHVHRFGKKMGDHCTQSQNADYHQQVEQYLFQTVSFLARIQEILRRLAKKRLPQSSQRKG